jgi:hypothetical protein
MQQVKRLLLIKLWLRLAGRQKAKLPLSCHFKAIFHVNSTRPDKPLKMFFVRVEQKYYPPRRRPVNESATEQKQTEWR